MIQKLSHRLATVAVAAAASMVAFAAHAEIDNSSLSAPGFRPHVRTFGLVYTLPKEVNDTLDLTTKGMLREKLLNAKLDDEAQRFNIPHVTVVHIHNADATTPDKMLKALPKLPGVLNVTLKKFYTTEAAKGAGQPWWLDLGIVKEGADFESMMAFNTTATAALAPLRDGPLPRCTGPVYAAMSDAAKELVKTVGVSGVNVVKDGKELRRTIRTTRWSTATWSSRRSFRRTWIRPLPSSTRSCPTASRSRSRPFPSLNWALPETCCAKSTGSICRTVRS